MSYHNISAGHRAKQAGFTLVELLVVIVVIGFMVVALFTFFKSTLFGYLDMQKTASNFTDLAQQSQRIGTVVRGSTGIVNAQDNSLEMYAYFYPTDTYVSKVKYYLNTGSTKLMADVTPMSANPPIGSELTAQKKTFTIISSFKQMTGVDVLDRVLAGIAAAKESGLEPIKINAVIVRGHNEDEVADFAAFAREHDVKMRFIEFMPLDSGHDWSRSDVVSGREI